MERRGNGRARSVASNRAVSGDRKALVLLLIRNIDGPILFLVVVSPDHEFSINCHNVCLGAAHPLSNFRNR